MMDRRDFLATGAVSTAGTLFFPGNLLAEETINRNLFNHCLLKWMASGKSSSYI